MHRYLVLREETGGCRLVKLASNTAKMWITVSGSKAQTKVPRAGSGKGSEVLAFLYPLDPYGFHFSAEIKGG